MLVCERLRGCAQVMLTIKRGQHGSTYGGNPVAAKVALAALQVIVDENLVDNSYKLGQLLRHELQAIQSRIITEVRFCLLSSSAARQPLKCPMHSPPWVGSLPPLPSYSVTIGFLSIQI